MTLVLDKLQAQQAIVGTDGRPTPYMMTLWQKTMQQIETVVNAQANLIMAIQQVQDAAEAADAAAAAAQAAADAADAQAAAAATAAAAANTAVATVETAVDDIDTRITAYGIP